MGISDYLEANKAPRFVYILLHAYMDKDCDQTQEVFIKGPYSLSNLCFVFIKPMYGTNTE